VSPIVWYTKCFRLTIFAQRVSISRGTHHITYRSPASRQPPNNLPRLHPPPPKHAINPQRSPNRSPSPYHHARNADLSNLALVSRKWRAIAQETLLRAPRFNLTYIDAFIRQLHRSPVSCAQITRFKIHSSSARRLPLCDQGLPLSVHGTLQREYVAIEAPRTWTRGFTARCKAVT
jgi:hypothetical protein